MTALPLPTNSASTHLGSSRPPPSRRGLLPDWHTVPSYRSLVISALAGGVGASIGRISMQEGINRAFGPTSSYGATPKPAKCTCDMDEVVEDAILFAQAAALKNPSSASTSAIANTASISNAPTPVHPTRTNVTTNATLNLSNATVMAFPPATNVTDSIPNLAINNTYHHQIHRHMMRTQSLLGMSYQ
ncbi:hypothetical protein FRB93_007808 [Tulasnella sp. JGI-2019a]|nr:hypothetical protein FRB93_007808 [Tulasnella sp. JGI-2019a]